MVRSTIHLKRSVALVLILNLLLLVAPRSAHAAPPLPASFYGTVQLNGAAVPSGTLVSAWVNGAKLAETAAFVGRRRHHVSASTCPAMIPPRPPSKAASPARPFPL